MSRSKRAARAEATPAPKPKTNLLRNSRGEIRAGWLLFASILAYVAASLAVRRGLLAAFAALFRAWGIDASNAHRAPGWARLVYIWHGSFISALAALTALALSVPLKRLWSVSTERARFSAKKFALAWLAGAGMVVGVAALCLIPDSMRLEWPLSRPHMDAAQPVLGLISLLGVLAEEVFARRVVYDGLRARWGEGRAMACAAATFVLIGGWPGSAIAALNALLLGLACGSVYARRGLWATVGFRWGWSLALVFLFGFGSGEHAVYRLYGLSERALTGGDAGFASGLWVALALAALLCLLERRRLAALVRRCRPKKAK